MALSLLPAGCEAPAAGGTGAAPDAGAAADGAAAVDAATDTGPAHWQAPFDPAVCGAAPYAWLPPAEVGEVVSWAELPLSQVPAAELQALLSATEFDGVAEILHGARNFRLRYTTQDRGQRREATAAVGVPFGDDVPDGPLPVVVWLHGTTGFSDGCVPSRDDLEAAAAPTVLASQGWIGVAPDYLGALGFGEPSPAGTFMPYLVGEPTALSSLDSIRAALAALEADPELPRPDRSRVVLLGGSQGGHAAFFVERYAPHYAPELGLVAAVAAVPPTDLLGHAREALAEWSDTTGAMAFVLTAMRAWYGRPDDLLGVLSDAEPHRLASRLEGLMATSCDIGGELDDVDTIEEVLAPELLTAVEEQGWGGLDPWGCYLAENGVATTSVPRVSDTPFLATFTEKDRLVLTPVEREDVPRLCGLGYRIEYLECAGLPHSEGGVAALPTALRWIHDRLAGRPWPQGDVCRVTPPEECEI